MKNLGSFLFFILGTFLSSVPCFAEEEQRHRWVGTDFAIGVPGGTSLQVLIRPTDWLRLGAGGNFVGYSGGILGSATVDPIRFPIVPTLTQEFGYVFPGSPGNVVGHKEFPSIEFYHMSTLLGIEVGSRDTFRIFVRGGPVWFLGNTTNLNEKTSEKQKDLSVSDVYFHGVAIPAVKLGFSLYF